MKVLVVHPAQQHSYRLAVALDRAGMLEQYITTVYNKPHSMTRLTILFLRGNLRKKAEGRRVEALSDDKVFQFCELEGLLKLLTLHLPLFQRFYHSVKYYSADHFARKVADYIHCHPVDAVVSYDDYSSVLFGLMKEELPHVLRIMDMSAANVLFMKEIYDRDMELQPSFANLLRKERKNLWDSDMITRAERELQDAQLFLVPSEFVANSLRYSGVQDAQIRFCPYGVDIDAFSMKEYPDYYALNRPLRFIYVGGVKEIKGIAYLLDTFLNIPLQEAKLSVIGTYDPTMPELQKFIGHVEFTGSVLHNEIPALLQQADVFVFPSLGDSFSLAVLEAAACGLPVIVSENTGASDLISDAVEGFIVPIQSTTALEEKIRYFIDHPNKIETMGRAARTMAEQNTWEAYSMRVEELFSKMEES